MPKRSHAGKSNPKVIKIQFNSLSNHESPKKKQYFLKIHLHAPKRHYNKPKVILTCQKCTQDDLKVIPTSSQGVPEAPPYHRNCSQVIPKRSQSAPKVSSKRHKLPQGQPRLPKVTPK